MTRPRLVWLALALAGWAAPAAAQDTPGSPYLMAGISLARQSGPTGTASEIYVTAPGGTTLGWLVGGGVVITPILSAEVEWARTGLMTAREPSRYGMTFNEERRDDVVSFVARVAVLRVGAVRIEPVGGLALTHASGWSQTERYLYYLTPNQVLVTDPKIEHRLDNSIGVTFGCDARIGSARIAVVPSFRLSHTGVSTGFYDGSSDNREIGAIYPGGYPDWTVRVSAAVRIGLGQR